MQKQRRLQRLSQHIAPENGPVQGVQLAGVLERVEGEGNQAEEVEVSGARGCPAAEENVDADGQVDEADEAQPQRQAAVQRLGDDHRLQGNAAAGDFVTGLAVNLGAIENALQVGYAHDGSVVGFGKQAFGLNVCARRRGLRRRVYSREHLLRLRGGILGQHPGPSQQVVRLNAGALAGTVGQHLLRFQPSRNLAPPNPIVRLLELAFLAIVPPRQQHQAGRGHGQQRRLQTVEKAGFHGGTLYSFNFVARRLPCKRNTRLPRDLSAID